MHAELGIHCPPILKALTQWHTRINVTGFRPGVYYKQQDKIFRRKCLSTGANFVHVYIEIWDKGILKFNKFSM